MKELGSDKHLTKFPILKPADMISYTDEFEKTMLDDYDTYSDSYTMMITDIEELKSIMRNIEIQVESNFECIILIMKILY